MNLNIGLNAALESDLQSPRLSGFNGDVVSTARSSRPGQDSRGKKIPCPARRRSTSLHSQYSITPLQCLQCRPLPPRALSLKPFNPPAGAQAANASTPHDRNTPPILDVQLCPQYVALSLRHLPISQKWKSPLPPTPALAHDGLTRLPQCKRQSVHA